MRRGGSVRPLFLLFAAIIVIAIVVVRLSQHSGLDAARRDQATGCTQVTPAFESHRSGIWLALSARVMRVLPDTDGTHVHQRFIVACSSGQTVLIVNDVSIGERVPVSINARVTVRGQYIWNAEGGLVHFTHHAVGSLQGGWILYQGRLYSLARASLL
jgi:hypothetical protein